MANSTLANRAGDNKHSARAVWNQDVIPVILRRDGLGEKIRARLPFHPSNRVWLRRARRFNPVWDENGRYWELPKAWFSNLVDRCLDRFGKVWVIQPYREQEICASACLHARGHVCECSCMGANHGSGNDGSWFEINETFAVRWGERELACRLLVATPR